MNIMKKMKRQTNKKNIIEIKTDNYYTKFAKDYLENFRQYNDLEKAIIIEMICRLIEKQYTVEECFIEISKDYNLNCKKIVFSAIKPWLKADTIKTKIFRYTRIDEIIQQCIIVMKSEVVNLAFKRK
jgi:hypothetical protein